MKIEMVCKLNRSALEWLGHIEKINASCLTKRVINAYVDGRAQEEKQGSAG